MQAAGIHFRNLLSISRFKTVTEVARPGYPPERFARHGYQTLAAGKIFHGGGQRFFQEYGGSMGGFGPRPTTKISQPHGHPLWDWGAFPEKDEMMPDYTIANWAVEKLHAIPEQAENHFLWGRLLPASRTYVRTEEVVDLFPEIKSSLLFRRKTGQT